MLLEKTEMQPQPSARERTARWISVIVHPIAFPLFTLAVAIYSTTRSPAQTARWVALALLLTSVPVSLLVSVQVLRRRWTDLDVSVRRQRYLLYPFGILCMLALTLVFAFYGAPEIAVRATAGIVLANMVDGLINFFYKVSAHATGAAACATVLFYVAPVYGIPGAAAALLVGWSRVVLLKHTRGQVVLGWAVGVASTAVALNLPLEGFLSGHG
ncbi:MAG TPA: phosphatase PAP2 family protein [Ktedonobacterales bacterium]|nr:phosphatase PAP2 family protein [Ktedonobacterales bacterium]